MNLEEEILKKLENIEIRLLRLENKHEPNRTENKKDLSIREFLNQKKPKGDVQKTLTIGYFFEQYKNMKSMNIGDFIQGYKNAKEPTPNKLNDKIYKNCKKGHMMEADNKKDNKKAWVLTNDGEKFVENNYKRTT